MSKQNRRDFLRGLFVASDDSSRTHSTLVCIFLRGGADTLNMLVPYGDHNYYAMRPNIAIKAPLTGPNAALKLDDIYALHPNLAPLLPLYHAGRLGIVQSVGSDNPSGSHFDAQDQMEHGEAYGHPLSGGWLGRHMRSLAAQKADTPLSAVAIGAAVPESLRGAPSASAISSVDDIRLESPAHDPKRVAQALAQLYGSEAGVLASPGKSTLALLRRVERLHDARQTLSLNSKYPDTEFGHGLREVARLVKARVGLEIACIDMGGWDTHFFQGSDTGQQAELIKELAQAFAAFDLDVGKPESHVTTIIMTEFGRRVYENSSLGTDHGRGFAILAVGPQVNGGVVHGSWPGLVNEDKDILGPAGLTINFDYRSVLSELLSGVAGNRRLDAVFPHFQAQAVGLIKGATVPIANADDPGQRCRECKVS